MVYNRFNCFSTTKCCQFVFLKLCLLFLILLRITDLIISLHNQQIKTHQILRLAHKEMQR